MERKLISHQLLRELICYDPETGLFRWAVPRPKIRVGEVAGCFSGKYVIVEILGVQYAAHRLAWFYVTGHWPKDQIDHKNLDKSDNRFANLREATIYENARNKTQRNKNGYKGVHHRAWLKEKPYEAVIKRGGKQVSLGCYPTAAEAGEVYKKAATELHGEFARF